MKVFASVTQSRYCERCELCYPPRMFEGNVCFLCHAEITKEQTDAERQRFLEIAAMIPEVDITDPVVYRALQVASEEGRLNKLYANLLNMETGTVRCRVCGMLNWDQEEADECCVPGLERHEWLIETGQMPAVRRDLSEAMR